ncbi:MAG: T9SS type A sorting domain-containing protein [Bacteroidales bacterium]|nr:T9SS type A sorting domain-containing protein [Bacteroidales bacterium]
MLRIATLLILTMAATGLTRGQTPLTQAIDFSAQDIHGDTIHLFDILADGKHVLIDFFFVDCTPCQAISPIVNLSYRDFGCNAGDVFFLSISGKNTDTNEDCRVYDSVYGVEYPTISGAEGHGNVITGKYLVTSFPTVILIAPGGEILEQHIWPVGSVGDLNAPILATGCEFQECAASCAEHTEGRTRIYPNPSNGSVMVEPGLEGDLIIQIHSIDGRIIAHQDRDRNSTLPLYFDGIPEGIYILSIRNEKRCISEILTVIR